MKRKTKPKPLLLAVGELWLVKLPDCGGQLSVVRIDELSPKCVRVDLEEAGKVSAVIGWYLQRDVRFVEKLP